MTAPNTTAPGGEAPAAAVPAEPVGSAIQQAVDKARAAAAASPAAPATPAAPGTPGAPAAPAPPPAAVAAPPANETPEQKAQREADEAVLAAAPAEVTAALDAEAAAAAAGEVPSDLVVEIMPRREGEAPLELELDNKEVADAVRAAIRGAVRAEQAHAIREEAQVLRDEAEAINYQIDLDPAAIVLERLTDPADIDHMARVLLTQRGTLERLAEWIADMIEKPETIAREASLVKAERIERRDKIAPLVAERRQVDANARAILRTTQRSIETLAPANFDDAKRDMLYRDVLSDLRTYSREKNLKLIDTRVIPGFIQRRLSFYGVAPQKTDSAPPAGSPPPAGKPPAASVPQPTVEQIRAARQRRLAAASAPPGAGTPAAGGMPKPPKYDPKQPGTAIQQAAASARRFIGRMAGGPK